MFIDFTPALSDGDTEILESELDNIANELCIEGVDIAGVVDDDHPGQIDSLDFFYEDGEDDAALAGYAAEVLGEFERLQSEGALSKDFRSLQVRVGRVVLRVSK